MSELVCKNIECKQFEKIQTPHKMSWVYCRLLQAIKPSEPHYCKECDKELQVKEIDMSNVEINVSINDFKCKTNAEKKQMLIDRNKQHFEKFEKKAVIEKKINAINKVKEQFNIK